MQSDVLSLLCDPDTRYSFELDGNTLRNTATGRVYPIRDDIPLFVSSLTGPNLKHQALYDRIAPVYDLGERLHHWITRKPGYRPALIAELDLKPGDRVLEVAVGTGANIPYLPRGVDIYGIDVSWGMLRKCRRNLRKWNRTAHLFQGEAGRLPFRAEVFDCVFHVGGINSFTFRERAVREMIWVAKPGAKIVVVDEIATALPEREPRDPAAAAPIAAGPAHVPVPGGLVPEEIEDVETRTFDEGKLYCLSFRKPLPPAAPPDEEATEA